MSNTRWGTTLGPKIDDVYRRLRADYVRHWVARPLRILPYTPMPINIPYEPTPPHFGGVDQRLFPGTSTEQLDGVVDLLMNWDEYTRRRTSVKGLVKEPSTTQPPAGRRAESPSTTTRPRNDQSAAQ